MEFCRLNDTQIMAYKTLWKDVFHDDDAFLSFFFAQKCPWAYGLVENGQLCSALTFVPYTLRVGQTLLQSAYLVGLVTREADRGKGCAYRLLEEAERELVREGVSAYLLYPAIPYSFYTKRGGFVADERLVYTLEKQQTFALDRPAKPVSETDDRAFLAQAFKTYNERFALVTERNEKDWDNRLYDLALDGGKVLRCGEAAGLYADGELREVYGSLSDVACLCNEVLTANGKLTFAYSRFDPLYRRLADARGALQLMPHAVMQILSADKLQKQLSDKEWLNLTRMDERRPDAFIYDEY